MSLEFQDDKKNLAKRRRNILFLVVQYLSDLRLTSAAEALIKETNLPIGSFQVCDNIDLDSMYLEYCSYFELKFGKSPKILKPLDQNIETTSIRKSALNKRKVFKQNRNTLEQSNPTLEVTVADSLNAALIVSKISNDEECTLRTVDILVERPLDKCSYYSLEWKEMADVVCRDLIKTNFDVQWDHIKGHENVRSILIESVLMPLKYPKLFVGVARPWKCILLHGPPGTGKTMLARALCTEAKPNVTFFNVCSSTIISKWRGESEKYIRVLFEVARYYAPSVIFIDEFEGLASKRDAISEHEASRRFKNEFLMQIDKLDEEQQNVFLLANTNLPWEVDAAFLRRFEKKILVGLPNCDDRCSIVRHLLPTQSKITFQEISDIATKTDGFTGDELRIACKEASMEKIRNAINTARQSSRTFVQISPVDVLNELDFWDMTFLFGEFATKYIQIMLCISEESDPTVQLKHLTVVDLHEAIKQMVPMSKHLIEKHINWNQSLRNQP